MVADLTNSTTVRLHVDMKSTPWSIGELAAEFGLATHVLRHWETRGLLHPTRDAAGRRHYGADDRNRVAVIVRGKQAGASLEVLAEILAADPPRRRALLEEHHARLEDRIASLRDAQRLSRHALECEHGDFVTCPNFGPLVEQTIESLRDGR